MRRIGGILGRNAFGPIHEHMLKVIACLDLLNPLAAAATAGDHAAVKRIASDIKRLEEEADAVKKAIRAQFTTSVLASVARSEVMALVKAQDDVADQCQRLSYELSLRSTVIPAFVANDAKALASAVSAPSRPLGAASRILDEAGGRIEGGGARKVTALLEEIESLVAAVEPLESAFLGHLFEREGEQGALDVVFMLRYAEASGKVSGKIENVADVLARLVTEEA
jgi:predicted phosphate transport protein (TIGR00153 family)